MFRLVVVTCVFAGVSSLLQLAAQSGSAVPATPSAASSALEQEARPSFAQWLDGVRAEALARGIRRDIVEQALADVVEPLPVVIERDRAQAETVLSLETYIARQVTTRRVRTGRQMMSTNRTTLEQVAAKYGVPVRIIGGVWGIESNFGRFSGVRPTISALATLAWDPRRGPYFRSELFNALQILDHGDIDLPRLKGSWAGAMGQPQFMPSSYLQFAEDFNGDGRRDIWSTNGDVFASIANYLRGHGWTPGQLWGREVTVPKAAAGTIARTVEHGTGRCQATRDMTVFLPLAEWQRLGVRAIGGRALPKADLSASLVSGASRHFLVYPNYNALLEYNCAHAYALSVALLGDRLAVPAKPATRATPRR